MTGLYVASNAQAVGAQIQLQRNTNTLSEVLTRLSTGLKINSGKDDPAGLIASELLKSDITATKTAIQNTQRANSIIAVADSALGQVSALLNDIRSLVNEAANTGAMTADQIAANQLQVDASIDSIDRIARTTTFQGKKLLDGSMDFRTSGLDSHTLQNVNITSANFGTRDSMEVDVKLLEEAKTARLIYNGTGVSQDTVVQIGGSTGTEIFKFGAGATTQDMADLINAASDSTGIVAHVEGLASRGIVELNGVGSNNGIVIIANEEGAQAGNYTFRIVKGETNDAYVVSDPSSSSPGVIEISLEESYEATYEGFIGMFDVTISTGNEENSPTALSITRGNINQAYLATSDTSAGAISGDGLKTLNVTDAGTGGIMSNLNGWTVKIGTFGAAAEEQAEYDYDAKTITVHAETSAVPATLQTNIQTAIQNALQPLSGSDAGTVDVAVAMTGTFGIGDSFTLAGGAAKGELVVTYKSGATAEDIQKLMNNVEGIQASLTSGVSASDLVPDVPKGSTYQGKFTSSSSDYVSNATANDVVTLINQKLSHLFSATLSAGDTGAAKMTYMDAAITYGDINLDNALTFMGKDDGPIIRLSTTDANGKPIIDQELSVSLLNPTDADIANGVTTKILQINLATDAAGNSITTAKDIVNLFNSLTAAQTGGVSASLKLPDGVDPNGRTWTLDGCGNLIETTDCNASYGNGIVQPTDKPGECEVQRNDLILLGYNQTVKDTNAIARIGSSTQPIAAAADATAGTGQAVAQDDSVVTLSTGTDGSLLNGVTVILKSHGGAAGANSADFDAGNGTLTISIAGTTALAADAIQDAIRTLVATVEDDIKTYNGSNSAGTGANITFAAVPAGGTAATLFGTGGISIEMGGGLSEGDVIETRGQTDTTSGNLVVTTDGFTSALNGIGFLFTTDPSQSGFDNETGDLTVYLNPATQAMSDRGQLTREVTEAINGAINANWEGIREYTKTTEGIAKVFAQVIGATAVTDLVGLVSDDVRIPSSYEAGSSSDETRGTSVTDPALIIEAVKPGTEMAGTKIVLQMDSTLAASTTEKAYVTAAYDKDTGVLTIKANTAALQSGTDGGLNAQLLADALNDHSVFKEYFKATAPISDIAGDDGDTSRTIAFSSDVTPCATMTGGYGIETGDNVINPHTGTSSGISMYGNNDDNQRLVIEAMDSGSANYVNVNVISGSFRTFCPLGLEMSYLAGTDARITVNGQKAVTSGDNFKVSSATFEMSGTLSNMKAGDSTSFIVTDGGATFQLGPDVVSSQQIRVGIKSVDSVSLGGPSGLLYQLKSGENADLSTNTKLADKIIQEAINSVAVTRGRLGAVQRSTLEPNQAVLEDTIEQLTAAEAIYSNADFAEESSRLTRAQILVQSSSQALAQANQFPQYAAQLIG